MLMLFFIPTYLPDCEDINQLAECVTVFFPFNLNFKYFALVADRVYASNGLRFGLNSKENRHNSVFAMQGQSVTIQQHRIY